MSREEAALFAPLKRKRPPIREIDRIIEILKKLIKNGVPKPDIKRLVQKIIDDERFKDLFVKDFVTACEKIGINPVPSP